MSRLIISMVLLLTVAASGQTRPVADPADAAALAKANEYAAKNGIRGVAVEASTSLPGGKWRRVVLINNDQDPALPFKVLLVNDAGRVADPAKEMVAVLAEIAGVAKDVAGYEAQFRLCLLMERAMPTLVIKDVKDIPDYGRRPLAKDLEAVVRAPWTYADNNGGTECVFYTYQQAGGMVERWVVTFDKEGHLARTEPLRLSTHVGAAVFYM